MIFKNRFNEIWSWWKILLVFLLSYIKKNYKECIIGLILGAITMSVIAIDNFKLINPISEIQINITLLYWLIIFIFVGFVEKILSRGYIISVLKQIRNK